jgi:hypothetical protein
MILQFISFKMVLFTAGISCLAQSPCVPQSGQSQKKLWVLKIDIYAPMNYTAPYVMCLMREDPLRGQVGGGWALEIETFLGPVKWHRAVRRVPFGAQKSREILF